MTTGRLVGGLMVGGSVVGGFNKTPYKQVIRDLKILSNWPNANKIYLKTTTTTTATTN